MTFYKALQDEMEALKQGKMQAAKLYQNPDVMPSIPFENTPKSTAPEKDPGDHIDPLSWFNLKR